MSKAPLRGRLNWWKDQVDHPWRDGMNWAWKASTHPPILKLQDTFTIKPDTEQVQIIPLPSPAVIPPPSTSGLFPLQGQ